MSINDPTIFQTRSTLTNNIIRSLYITYANTFERNSPLVSIFGWEELTCWSQRCEQVSSRRSLLRGHSFLPPFSFFVRCGRFHERNRISTGGHEVRRRGTRGHDSNMEEGGHAELNSTEVAALLRVGACRPRERLTPRHRDFTLLDLPPTLRSPGLFFLFARVSLSIRSISLFLRDFCGPPSHPAFSSFEGREIK